jgi:UDP-N-acetylglucosamine 2-epimerase (non-hydrolysing)
MVPEQTLHDLTAKVILGVTEVLEAIRPDIVLVQGDTTTTFGVALAAFYMKIPVGHVEAGLRTYDRFHPFPEEINRHLTTVTADFHFAPTETAKKNLLHEGVAPARIRVTGNTVIDALLSIVRPDYGFSNSPLAALDARKKWILVTAHRRENFGEPIGNICAALEHVAETEEVEIIYPVHPNPNIADVVQKRLESVEHIHLLPPLSYDLFAQVMNRSTFCLTDSGGIQEEAPSLGKPVLVLREVTERPEAVTAGTALIVGTDTDRIVKETCRLLHDERYYSLMANRVNPYGDGKAATRIVSALLHEFGVKHAEEEPFFWNYP